MLTRRTITVAVAVALAAAAAAVPLVAHADSEELVWGGCSGNDVVAATDPDKVPTALECAEVSVPVDWNDPDRTVAVQVSRLAYTGDGDSAGAVIVVPGGPGGAGTEDLISAGETFAGLRKHFDVVGFDPRGHYLDRAMPIADCYRKGPVFAAPKTRAQYDSVHKEQRAAVEGCRSHDPKLFDSLDSLSQARDLEALRVGLGDQPINIHATSYGGTIAQSYAREFPQRVRTMYLDGAAEHVREPERAEADYFANREELFGRFVDWCARASDCALSGTDVAQRWQRLIAAADAEPIPASKLDGLTFDGHDLQGNVAAFMNRDQAWPQLSRGIVEAEEGDASTLAAPSIVYGGKPYVPARSAAISCGDGQGYDSYGEYRQGLERGRRLSPNFPDQRANRGLLCVGMAAPVANPPAPLPGGDLPPLLAVGAANEDMVGVIADQVPGSRFLRYQGYGHSLYLSGKQCVIDNADRYFVDGTLPGPEVDCPQE